MEPLLYYTEGGVTTGGQPNPRPLTIKVMATVQEVAVTSPSE